MFNIKDPEFTATVESAQSMIEETFAIDVSKIFVQEGGMSNRYLGNYNLKLQQIAIDTKACRELNVDTLLVLLHEYLHYIERLEGPELLTTNDAKEWLECIAVCSQKIFRDAMDMFKSVQEIKTNENAYKVYNASSKAVVDYINNEEVLPLDKPLWKFLSQNLNKIDATVEYNDFDGHTDLWMELKESLEDYWNIKIPVALAIDDQQTSAT